MLRKTEMLKQALLLLFAGENGHFWNSFSCQTDQQIGHLTIENLAHLPSNYY